MQNYLSWCISFGEICGHERQASDVIKASSIAETSSGEHDDSQRIEKRRMQGNLINKLKHSLRSDK